MPAMAKNVYKILLFLLIVVFIGCAKESNKSYILMEKQLADINVGAGHDLPTHRTTAKIILPSVIASETKQSKIKNILTQALKDLQKDDPELDAVIIWAYKDRKELNQTFTLGKLEYSKDKRGWDGKH